MQLEEAEKGLFFFRDFVVLGRHWLWGSDYDYQSAVRQWRLLCVWVETLFHLGKVLRDTSFPSAVSDPSSAELTPLLRVTYGWVSTPNCPLTFEKGVGPRSRHVSPTLLSGVHGMRSESSVMPFLCGASSGLHCAMNGLALSCV